MNLTLKFTVKNSNEKMLTIKAKYDSIISTEG